MSGNYMNYNATNTPLMTNKRESPLANYAEQPIQPNLQPPPSAHPLFVPTPKAIHTNRSRTSDVKHQPMGASNKSFSQEQPDKLMSQVCNGIYRMQKWMQKKNMSQHIWKRQYTPRILKATQ